MGGGGGGGGRGGEGERKMAASERGEREPAARQEERGASGKTVDICSLLFSRLSSKWTVLNDLANWKTKFWLQ